MDFCFCFCFLSGDMNSESQWVKRPSHNIMRSLMRRLAMLYFSPLTCLGTRSVWDTKTTKNVENVKKEVVIHYNCQSKPWLEIGLEVCLIHVKKVVV